MRNRYKNDEKFRIKQIERQRIQQLKSKRTGAVNVSSKATIVLADGTSENKVVDKKSPELKTLVSKEVSGDRD